MKSTSVLMSFGIVASLILINHVDDSEAIIIPIIKPDFRHIAEKKKTLLSFINVQAVTQMLGQIINLGAVMQHFGLAPPAAAQQGSGSENMSKIVPTPETTADCDEDDDDESAASADEDDEQPNQEQKATTSESVDVPSTSKEQEHEQHETNGREINDDETNGREIEDDEANGREIEEEQQPTNSNESGNKSKADSRPTESGEQNEINVHLQRRKLSSILARRILNF